MTEAEHAAAIKATLDEVEATNRAHHRAIVKHHATLAAFAAEYGPQAKVSDEIVTLAAAPKNPPSQD